MSSKLYSTTDFTPATQGELKAVHEQVLKLLPIIGTLMPMMIDLIDFLISKNVINREEFERFCLDRVNIDREKFAAYQAEFNAQNGIVSTEN